MLQDSFLVMISLHHNSEALLGQAHPIKLGPRVPEKILVKRHLGIVIGPDGLPAE